MFWHGKFIITLASKFLNKSQTNKYRGKIFNRPYFFQKIQILNIIEKKYSLR